MCAEKKPHKLYHYLKQYVCMYLCFITVYAEKCTTNGDCGSVMCGSGFHVICEHSQEVGVSTNGGICTCAQDNYRTCFLIDETCTYVLQSSMSHVGINMFHQTHN